MFPWIVPFKTKKQKYLFDANINQITPVSEGLFKAGDSF